MALLTGGTVARADGEPESAGPPPGPAPVASVVNWSGPYVAVGAGAASVDQELDVDSSVFENFNILGGLLDITGRINDESRFDDDDWEGFGTIQAGYDRQFGQFVIGGFVDFDFFPDSESTFSDDVDGTAVLSILGFPIASDSITARVDSEVELDHAWSVGGRVGYLVRPNTLLYVLGGYTQAEVESTTTLTYVTGFNSGDFGTSGLSVKSDEDLKGYFIGGGGEVMLSEHLALKLEYRYAHYGSESDSDSDRVFTDFGVPGILEYTRNFDLDTDIEADIHSVRGAVVFRFGDDRRPVESLK